jgi:hypothetical protein
MQLSKLSKFSEFFQLLNEVYMPILDAVIDGNGVIYNGEESRLVKGRVERQQRGVISRILGTDNKNYPAGVDKNGRIHAIKWDDENRALDFEGNPIPIPVEIKRRYKIKDRFYYVSREHDYYSLIPKIATGWVNVKIDMEIVKRVRRYAKSLGTNKNGHDSFVSKLLEFERLSSLEREEKYIKRLRRGAIQKEMSCILLLHHINEIKDFFNPSSSGFLFESFIAGLIPDARIKEDNSPVDIITGHGRYQCKLVDWKENYVEVTQDIDPSKPIYLEWYLIARKFVDRIELIVIDGQKMAKKIEDGTIGGLITNAGKFSIPKIKGLVGDKSTIEDGFISQFKIDLTDIEGRINNLGESLKSYLDDLYDELSKFQYNVETIITGVNEKGKVVKNQNEFEIYYNSAQNNVSHLKTHLENLVSEINK